MPSRDEARIKRQRSSAGKQQNLEMWLAFVFGIVFVTVMLVIAIAIPNPSSTSFFTYRVVLALAAAGIAAVIPGFLNVEISLGLKTVIRAGGAIAVFLIVFLMNPAELVAK